jgi:hypothetical protein
VQICQIAPTPLRKITSYFHSIFLMTSTCCACKRMNSCSHLKYMTKTYCTKWVIHTVHEIANRLNNRVKHSSSFCRTKKVRINYSGLWPKNYRVNYSGRKQNGEKAKWRILHFTKKQNGEFYISLFKAKCRISKMSKKHNVETVKCRKS